jgi:serine protease Do
MPRRRVGGWLVIGLVVWRGIAQAADGPAPPPSFARPAAAARLATIVLRAPMDEYDIWAPAPEAASPDVTLGEEQPGAIESLAERELRTLASGVIVDPRGLAVTSARAVLLHPRFEVFLVDGTPVKAALVALDRRSDIAVLSLDGGGVSLPYLPFGDSDRVVAGDWIIFVGAPSGLEGTVTAGVVTATPVKGSRSPLGAFLQTDAAASLGNLGGPVVNPHGEVIGLGTELSGYVRPSNAVRAVYVALIESGRVSRTWLGVTAQPLTPELARAAGAPEVQGVLLADVDPAGPGAAAGLRPGDVVVTLGGAPVTSRVQFDRAIEAHAPGAKVTIQARRAGRTLALSARLGQEPVEVPPALARARLVLGIDARPITPTQGVRAALVDAAGPAGRAGLVAGDVIREIDRRPIRSLADFQAAVASLKPGRPVLVQIQRGESAAYAALVPDRLSD